MINNDKIAVVVCYMGKLPWYFDYFIHSCKFNPSVDFIIITDDRDYRKPLSVNITMVYKTIQEINRLAADKLDLPVKITNGYKLCDFKPTYGVLFSELLKSYHFWAFGDIDLIFGNIRDFITDELLKDNDLINVRHDYLAGQFLLFRNTRKMNYLFTLSKDFRKVLSNSEHYCFDETNFQWQGFSDGKLFYEIESEIESMTHLVKRLQHENYINAYFDFLIVEGVPGKIRWEQGKLYYKNKYEVLLYHLVLFKKVCITRKSFGSIPNSFLISPTRIYQK